ncbi:MAG: SBBP repeat-containing protein, partial [Planctomycetes bacterium]|nr:SBBP repeat-containing protein [Planctomycetota bacterium]
MNPLFGNAKRVAIYGSALIALTIAVRATQVPVPSATQPSHQETTFVDALHGAPPELPPSNTTPAPDASLVPHRQELPSQDAPATLAKMPGLLIRNEGQLDERVKFCLRDRNVSVFFTSQGFTLSAVGPERGIALQAELLGGRPAEPQAFGEGTTRVNSYIGGQARWREGLPSYEKIVYTEVWPGVDVIYEPRPAGLEYTLALKPGADVAAVRFAYRGAQGISAEPSGGLKIQTELGDFLESKPIAFQQDGDGLREVDSRFVVMAGGTYGFEVGAYDHERPLFIDPTLTYGTFLGRGSGNSSNETDDRSRAIAIDGDGNVYVSGETNSDFPVTTGAYDTGLNGLYDIYVTKVDASGASLAWSTFLGGANNDVSYALDLDSSRNVYVTGYTWSSDFPATAGAFDTTLGGATDAFVAKLNASGASLAWSTFLGGTADDAGNSIDVDSSGNVYLTGFTGAATFPTTAG